MFLSRLETKAMRKRVKHATIGICAAVGFLVGLQESGAAEKARKAKSVVTADSDMTTGKSAADQAAHEPLPAGSAERRLAEDQTTE